MTNKVEKSNPEYDAFYAKGGWKNSAWRQKAHLKNRIVKPLKLEKGSKILEIGCGMGLQSHLLTKMGFDVTGVDNSAVGIDFAREHYPETKYLHMDVKDLPQEFEEESFDILLSRGMSWYHYELSGVNKNGIDVPAATKELFRFLKKGGLFVLEIATDYSGRRPESGIHQNELGDYTGLFEPFGEIIYISDCKGKLIRDESDSKNNKKGIIIATRK